MWLPLPAWIGKKIAVAQKNRNWRFRCMYFFIRPLTPFPPSWRKGYSQCLRWLLNDNTRLSNLTQWSSLLRPRWTGSEPPLYTFFDHETYSSTFQLWRLFVLLTLRKEALRFCFSVEYLLLKIGASKIGGREGVNFLAADKNRKRRKWT